MTDMATILPKSAPRRALHAMVVDDESVIRGPLALCLETLGHQVVEASNVEEAMAQAHRLPLDVALVDLRLGASSGLDLMTQLLAVHPRLKIIMITAYASVDVAVRAITRGATDFLCKPFTPDQVSAAVARVAALRDLESDVGAFADRWGTAGPEADFATTSSALQAAVMTARRVAPTDTAILISGEPGIGKGILARAIHGWSKRPDGPFGMIDCSARSTAYVDLSLFGDTLAGDQIVTHQEAPLLLKAEGGTLLIKRMEHLSPRSRQRLAQVLEHRTFDYRDRVEPAAVNCRVIATTSLPAAQWPGDRLSVLLDKINIQLPPLRERLLDIPLLAQRYLAFCRQHQEKQVLGLSVDALDHLTAYGWPNNLRELREVVAEAFAVTTSAYIESRDLRPVVRDTQVRRLPRAGDLISLEAMEAAHIREILASGKSLQEAADILGLELQALYRRRRQYGLA